MTIDHMLDFLLNDFPRYLQLALMVVGGLRILSRYTRWKWDDKLFSQLERPLQALAKRFPKRNKKKVKRGRAE